MSDLLKNKKLMGIFRDETEEHIKNITRELLALEKDVGNEELLEDIYREAHTLKGSSRMMGFNEIGNISHSLEDLLQALKEGKIKFGEKLKEIIFEGLQVIKTLLEDKISNRKSKVDVEAFCVKSRGVKEEKDHSSKRKKPEKKPDKKEAKGKLEKEAKAKAKAPKKRRAQQSPVAGEDTVRVGIVRLDDLVNLAGEIETSRIKFEERSNIIFKIKEMLDRKLELWGKLKEDMIHLTRDVEFSTELKTKIDIYDNINQQVESQIGSFYTNYGDDIAQISIYLKELCTLSIELRMLPLSTVFDIFPYAVQQIAMKYGKKVNLRISGDATKLDKKIIDGIRDPLLHLMNNAIAHGVEAVEERAVVKKIREGQVNLNAYHDGNSVFIECVDDGRGIDPDKIKAKAVSLGLLREEDIIGKTELISYIFKPGFSTAVEVNDISGRGVGMDVVRKNIEDLGGSIKIESELGQGTKIILQLPVTLTTANVLLIILSGQVYAIPAASVDTTVRVPLDKIKEINNKRAFVVNGKIIPLIMLSDVLCLDSEFEFEKKVSIVVVKYGEQRLGLVVDKFIGSRNVVIKDMGEYLKKFKCFSGATLLSDGEIVLILRTPHIFESVEGGIGAAVTVENKVGVSKKTTSDIAGEEYSILVVDDAVTTRELERQILEAAGYKAEVASDGNEALLKIKTSNYDLVVSDVQMPVMNGLQMVRELRKDEEYKELPVILVTGLGTEEDIKKGMDAGASSYFVKKNFDQAKLLEMVKRLIENRAKG